MLATDRRLHEVKFGARPIPQTGARYRRRVREEMNMPPGNIEIDIPPPLTVRQVRELKQLILDALKNCSALTLRLPQAAAADLSFVQLIEAARIYAARAGVGLSLAGPAEGELAQLIGSAGLPSDARTFWLSPGAAG